MTIYHGDCFEVLLTLPEASIDACVTDPPYGIGFMGKEWDSFKPGKEAARIVPNKSIESDNPNLKGRTRGPASSPSAVEYDYSVKGLRAFQTWTEGWAREVFRVLKPGAHIVVCGAPRAYHRMASGLEDAGFEIRDCLAWLFSTGFPKSLNFGCKCGGNALPYNHDSEPQTERAVRRVWRTDVSPAVDASDERGQVLLDGLQEHGVSQRGAARPESETTGREQPGMERRELHRAGEGLPDDTDAGASSSASERLRAGAHRGRGEDPRPPIEAERGSASQGSGPGEQRAGQSASLRLPSRTLDGGASERGSRCARCGGLTAARGLGTALKPAHEPIVLARKPFKGTIADNYIKHGTGALDIEACRIAAAAGDYDHFREPNNIAPHSGFEGKSFAAARRSMPPPHELGRWPANVVIDDLASMVLDEQSGELVSGANPEHRGSDKFRDTYSAFKGQAECVPARGLDIGGASRFYYCAKPSREERDMGCGSLPTRQRDESRLEGNPGGDNPRNRGLQPRGNFHPTVKPVELMRWLVRLVTPIGGTVLDPFLGSGTTGMACRYELREFIGIEREAEYLAIAERRIAAVAPLFGEIA